MNIINSSAPIIVNPNGVKHENYPINTDHIVYMAKVYFSRSEIWKEVWGIRFMLTKGEVDWRYDNELTRDNRFAEILQYLGTKLF